MVTALEFTLFPYREVYAGMFLWPYERHLDVLHSWYAWTRSAPDAVTTSFRIMHFPPLDDLPPFLSGRSVVVVDGAFAGDVDAGRTAVAHLRALAPELDTWGPASPAALSHLHMDPEQPVPVVGESSLLGEIDAAGLDAFAAAVQPPLLLGELRHLGGALSRVADGAGALGSLHGEYALLGGGIVADSSREIDAALVRLRARDGRIRNRRALSQLHRAPGRLLELLHQRRLRPPAAHPRQRRSARADGRQPPDRADTGATMSPAAFATDDLPPVMLLVTVDD